MNEIIKTNNLTKKFKGKPVVDKINLSINKGEIYGFLGPNGAGKTTTIRMLLGLMEPTNGQIELFGEDAKANKIKALKKIGSLVESPSYYGHLTARENLEALRRILQVPKSRIDEVLSIVRLTKDADRAVKGYSLGMKQRLGIASALLGNPELLILDEPTNGLDPSGIHEIRDLIKKMPTEFGITILISSHLLSEIDQMASQVGIISNGKMIFQDSIENLRSKAKAEITVKVQDTKKAKALLLSKGILTDIVEDRLISQDMSDEKIAAMINLLVTGGHSVYRVEEKRKSLEDIFLDLTSEGGLKHANSLSS
ncbi:ABC-2 type transport system ATP-binding protein [Metabacillus crassostreae]|uniref:ABC transporter ATP-binding protein n=1 Tax=Metabacillus crassostreae TaxID=929098 RepID=UPI0019597AF6|nr:ABC transporter ATP-binding protein [Metabacillus crassostreae]MBM7606346.1 ABC-2 type transport system ATP-binding protein [Metabacillus crassostreae]